MEVLDGCWQNEDRNPNIGFYRVSINPVMDSYPSQVICLEYMVEVGL